jgi:hypothetical protein
MTGTPLLVLAVALFAISFVLERVLIYLNARRKRNTPELPEPIVTGGGRLRGQAAGYVAEPTIHRTDLPPSTETRE